MYQSYDVSSINCIIDQDSFYLPEEIWYKIIYLLKDPIYIRQFMQACKHSFKLIKQYCDLPIVKINISEDVFLNTLFSMNKNSSYKNRLPAAFSEFLYSILSSNESIEKIQSVIENIIEGKIIGNMNESDNEFVELYNKTVTETIMILDPEQKEKNKVDLLYIAIRMLDQYSRISSFEFDPLIIPRLSSKNLLALNFEEQGILKKSKKDYSNGAYIAVGIVNIIIGYIYFMGSYVKGYNQHYSNMMSIDCYRIFSTPSYFTHGCGNFNSLLSSLGCSSLILENNDCDYYEASRESYQFLLLRFLVGKEYFVILFIMSAIFSMMGYLDYKHSLAPLVLLMGFGLSGLNFILPYLAKNTEWANNEGTFIGCFNGCVDGNSSSEYGNSSFVSTINEVSSMWMGGISTAMLVIPAAYYVFKKLYEEKRLTHELRENKSIKQFLNHGTFFKPAREKHIAARINNDELININTDITENENLIRVKHNEQEKPNCILF